MISDTLRNGAIIVDLRRRWSSAKRSARKAVNTVPGINISEPTEDQHKTRSMSIDGEDPSKAWRGSQESVVDGFVGGDEDDEGESGDEEIENGGLSRYSTYWPRGKPGSLTFPPASHGGDGDETEEES